jgi:hypothetical protein
MEGWKGGRVEGRKGGSAKTPEKGKLSSYFCTLPAKIDVIHFKNSKYKNRKQKAREKTDCFMP